MSHPVKPPEVHTLNTASRQTHKAVAAHGARVKVGGLNLPASSAVALPSGQKYETLIVPSTSAPNWSSYFTIDVNERGVNVNDMVVQFNLGAVVGTGWSGYFNPACFFFTRCELLMGGSVIDTIYGQEQFILNQWLEYDEDRLAVNNAMGNYSSDRAITNRAALSSTSTTNTLYVPLKCFVNQVKLGLFTEQHKLQLRFYMDSLSNVLVTTAGTLTSCAINSVNLILDVTRHDSADHHAKVQELAVDPHHNVFHTCSYGTFNVASGVSSSTLVLSPIVGNVACLFFTIRPTSTGLTGTGMWNYTALSSFHLLDQASSSLVGGQPIPHYLATNILNGKWCKSSYCQENGLAVLNNNSNVYMWSFSSDPVAALSQGLAIGSRRFTGAEQLVLNYTSALAGAVQVDIYALMENILEKGHMTVKKISL